jgi:hypothetical protein
MKLSQLHIGAEVYWTDPCEENGDEHTSGYYTIVDINAKPEDFHTGEDPDQFDDIVVYLKNEAGSELEAYNSELS